MGNVKAGNAMCGVTAIQGKPPRKANKRARGKMSQRNAMCNGACGNKGNVGATEQGNNAVVVQARSTVTSQQKERQKCVCKNVCKLCGVSKV